MKFESIKVNDVVYRREAVAFGWGNKKYFWVKRIVTKVTNKQFYVNGVKNRFKKEDGSETSGGFNSRVKNIGDKDNEYNSQSGFVKDESKEMNEFKRLVEANYYNRTTADELSAIGPENHNGNKIKELLTQAKILMMEP